MHPKSCPDMSIDDFNISEELRAQLKEAGFHTVQQVVSFLESTLGCSKLIPELYQHISFMRVLDELRNIGYWPDRNQYNKIPIEVLNVDERCLNSLRRLGFKSIVDVVMVIEEIFTQGPLGSRGGAIWMQYLDEILAALQAKGYWPQCPDK